MIDDRADLVIPPAERKTLQTIARDQCRWPYGDPRAKDFYFCGKARAAPHAYCEFHVRRGLTPSRPFRPTVPS